MKKFVVIAAAAIMLITFLGIFASYQYYKYYQDKPPKTASAPLEKSHPPVVAPKPPEKAATSPALKTPAGTEEPMHLEFLMTSAIVLPEFKSALIFNTLTNKEDVCQEGSFLHSKSYGRWTVFKIQEKETLIQQYYPDGSVAKEHTLKLTPKPDTATAAAAIVQAYKPGEKQAEQFKKDGVDMSSPEQLDKLLDQTPASKVLGIVRNVPPAVVDSVLNALPQEYLKQKIKDSPLGMAVTEDTYKDRNPADLVNILLKVADDYKAKGENMVLFATEVNKSDNSPISPTATFSGDVKKIYACFENKGPLANLDRVITKWSNTYSMKIAYWNALPITASAPHNFIFVKPEGKWEPGRYLVTIYKNIQDAEPAAYGEFEVK